jgi:hypothetical protein
MIVRLTRCYSKEGGRYPPGGGTKRRQFRLATPSSVQTFYNVRRWVISGQTTCLNEVALPQKAEP